MKKRYRVRSNARFQEIRQNGRSVSDELAVVCALPNGLPYSRFGFSVSSRIGGAVERNRIKRQLREAVRLRMAAVKPGWDVVIIARRAIRSARYVQMDRSCARLLRRAHLLQGSVADSENAADGLKERRPGKSFPAPGG